MPKRKIRRRSGEGVTISGPAIVRVTRGVTLVIEAPGEASVARISRVNTKPQRARPRPPRDELPPCEVTGTDISSPVTLADWNGHRKHEIEGENVEDVQDNSVPHRTERNTVLFLCTGNFYRSRFAEIYFNWLARRDNLTTWIADSRGLALNTLNYGPISLHTRRYLEQLEIPLPEPLRMPIDAAEPDFQTARLIVALKEAEHRPLMQQRFPTWAEQVEYWRVHDLDYAEATEALPQVKGHVEALWARLQTL